MFIYFGTDTFNQLNDVHVQNSMSSFSDLKCFTHLSNFGQPFITDVCIGWSYLLFKTDYKIYHAGFWRSSKHFHLTHISTFDNQEIDKITCGFKNSLKLTKNGYCCSFSDKDFHPRRIDFGESNGKIKDIITDDLNTLALTTDGNVYILNNNEETLSPSLLSMPVSVKEVACGKEHVLLLSNSGRVFSYGFGSRGQLGHSTIENLNEPIVIEALDGIEIKTISCGGWHSAAISTEGDLYMWGWNESGQLGLPCNELHGDDLPMEEIETVCCLPKVIDLDGELLRLVGCGSRHTAVLTENYHLWTWGWNGYGQLGHKKTLLSDKPERIDLPSHFLPSNLKCKFWSTLIVGSLKES